MESSKLAPHTIHTQDPASLSPLTTVIGYSGANSLPDFTSPQTVPAPSRFLAFAIWNCSSHGAGNPFAYRYD